MSKKKIRPLTDDERAIIQPVLAHREASRVRVEHAAEVLNGAQQELASIEVSLSALAAAFVGKNTDDVVLDPERMELYEIGKNAEANARKVMQRTQKNGDE